MTEQINLISERNQRMNSENQRLRDEISVAVQEVSRLNEHSRALNTIVESADQETTIFIDHIEARMREGLSDEYQQNQFSHLMTYLQQEYALPPSQCPPIDEAIESLQRFI